MSFFHIESPGVNDSLTHLPKQFTWENDSMYKFRDTLRSPNLQLLIRDYLHDSSTPTNDENNSLKNVENIVLTAAKPSLRIKITKKRRRTRSFPNKKWFGKECRFRRHELR